MERKVTLGVLLSVRLTLTGSTILRLDMEAVPENKPTANQLRPAYLLEPSRPQIRKHTRPYGSDMGESYHPVDDNTIPTGEIRPVKGTPFYGEKSREVHP